MQAGWKLWPFAHLITYGLVPVEQRLLWVDCVELIWVTILSTWVSNSNVSKSLIILVHFCFGKTNKVSKSIVFFSVVSSCVLDFSYSNEKSEARISESVIETSSISTTSIDPSKVLTTSQKKSIRLLHLIHKNFNLTQIHGFGLLQEWKSSKPKWVLSLSYCIYAQSLANRVARDMRLLQRRWKYSDFKWIDLCVRKITRIWIHNRKFLFCSLLILQVYKQKRVIYLRKLLSDT